MSAIIEFNLYCPSCNQKLRYGMQTKQGTVSHVVWCSQIKCDGCRGDGGMLSEALADLAKNYGKRKVRK